MVVDPHSLVSCSTCVISGSECRAQSVFLLEDAVKSFCVSVFVAVVLFGHAYWKVAVSEGFDEVVTAVLASTIRVVDRISVVGQVCEGSIECYEVGFAHRHRSIQPS